MLWGPFGPLLFCGTINIPMNTFKEHLNETRMEKRKIAVDRAREYIEDLAKELANEHDDYETFLGHMKKLVPQISPGPGGTIVLPNETGPIHMDLQWIWQHFNTQEQQKFKDAWDSYGEARAKQDPSVVSRDKYGNVWTGD
jgi:hypothetical protein